jgi:hypothetical protein
MKAAATIPALQRSIGSFNPANKLFSSSILIHNSAARLPASENKQGPRSIQPSMDIVADNRKGVWEVVKPVTKDF